MRRGEPWAWAVGALVLSTALWACREQPTPAVPEKAPAATDVTAPEGPGKKNPVIACDEPLHEFGKVIQGEEMKHVFTIRNMGDGVLNILSARGG